MVRYIDADLLIENIAKIKDLRTLSTKTIGEAISNAPTADVVEVVRCKDCKLSRVTEDERYLFCMQFADTVDCQAFCSYGEKRDT